MARSRLIVLALTLMAAGHAWPGKADVLQVKVRPSATGSGFDFSVTVRHADTGWDHYANSWEVVGPRGEILATRTLLHPHVGEQPFTRGLRGLVIPRTTTWVRLRASDLVHGQGGREVTVSVPHPPSAER